MHHNLFTTGDPSCPVVQLYRFGEVLRRIEDTLHNYRIVEDNHNLPLVKRSKGDSIDGFLVFSIHESEFDELDGKHQKEIVMTKSERMAYVYISPEQL